MIAYLRGIPNFGASIALLEDKTVILGVINEPSFESKLKEGVVEIQHIVLKTKEYKKSFVKLTQKARRIRMSDSMNVGMAYVACGKRE